MKKLLTTILIFSSLINLKAQFADCNCNDLFDKDVRTEHGKFDRQDTKADIYKWFVSNTQQRQSLLEDDNFDLNAKAIVKKIPIDVGFGSSSSSQSEIVRTIYNESINQQFLSDLNLNILINSYVPINISENYKQCIEGCKFYKSVTTNGGVTLSNASSIDGLVALELKYISNPAGQATTIDKATYSSGNVIGGLQFRSGRKIKDRQVFYEQIKLSQPEDLVVTISFKEPVGTATLTIPNTKRTKQANDAPLGTIVASLLSYEQFLQLNGLLVTSDLNDIIWAPCDGRAIGSEQGTYGAFSGGVAPDLRGQFLRGANNMGFPSVTVPPAKTQTINPQNKSAGDFQPDSFQGHWHMLGNENNEHGHTRSYGPPGGSGPPAVENSGNRIHMNRATEIITDKLNGDPRIDNETRPKNITVYYYIKIR